MDFFPSRGFDFGLDLFKDHKDSIMKTDISEIGDSYLLEIDLPGFQKQEIKIDYQDQYLTVIAKKEETLEEKKEYIRKERVYGEYKRSFYVGSISEQQITANYENGILKIMVPKEGNVTKKTSISID